MKLTTTASTYALRIIYNPSVSHLTLIYVYFATDSVSLNKPRNEYISASSEDRRHTFLRNFGDHLQDRMASGPRKPQSTHRSGFLFRGTLSDISHAKWRDVKYNLSVTVHTKVNVVFYIQPCSVIHNSSIASHFHWPSSHLELHTTEERGCNDCCN